MNRYYNESGSLFRNDRRRTDKDPEFRGQANIAGIGYWVAAWKNKDKNGNPYLRLRFTEQQQQQRPPRNPATRSAYPPRPAPPEERIPTEDPPPGWTDPEEEKWP